MLRKDFGDIFSHCVASTSHSFNKRSAIAHLYLKIGVRIGVTVSQVDNIAIVWK